SEAAAECGGSVLLLPISLSPASDLRSCLGPINSICYGRHVPPVLWHASCSTMGTSRYNAQYVLVRSWGGEGAILMKALHRIMALGSLCTLLIAYGPNVARVS